MSAQAGPWPTGLKVSKDRQTLHISFESGESFALPAELLRVESPSAEVRGHGGDEKQIVAGKAQVKIVGAEPVGNYAVRLIFDDGHETGLYSWTYLMTMGREAEALWADYLAALEARGLTRGLTCV
jgi:DUF971 family protein